MKRGWLLNFALLAVVAALAWTAWRMPSSEESAATALSTAKPADVARVALMRPGMAPVELQRQGTQWMITAPLRARADEFQVMRMLTVLEARPRSTLLATDLSRFELDPPAAILDIDGVRYGFGGINPVTREQYLLRGETVYVLELRHGAALPATAKALIRRVLLTETEQPVAVKTPEFTVQKSDGRWLLTPPAATGLGGDDLQRYIDHWREASAAIAEPHDGRPALAEIGITLASGTTLALGVLEFEPRLVLWRRDNGLQYTFLAAASRALLGAPGATLESEKK